MNSSVRIFPLALLPGLLLTSTGCHSLRLHADQEKVREQLCQIDPRRDPLARRTPIIDVHTHTFNARYLPLRNILLGKRDAAAPVSWLISDHCAETLARAVIDRTELAPAAGEDGVKRLEGRQHYPTGPVCKILLGLLNKADTAGCWEKGASPKQQMERLDTVAAHMSFGEELGIRVAGEMMGMEATVEHGTSKEVTKALVRFLWTITQSDARVIELYRTEYEDVPMKGTPLMVSHMMDLAPVYNQEEDGAVLLKYATQQIRRMQSYQAHPDSNLIYFVAYNPYRDHWHGGQPHDALRLVQKAIRQHGAWGVKFYPPSGYRAGGNQVRRRSFAWLTGHPGRQWDARYAALGKMPGAELDRRTDELLKWCIAEQIPVFTHSGTREFEARKGYGLHHSNPKFWRKFLEAHPGPNNTPCPLRLCLGHAGGDSYWLGGRKNADWGREVYDLCREFPNVYCEITTHGELAEPKHQAYYVDHLARLFADTSHRQVPGHRHPQKYPFSRKLLYGTDWYLPAAAERGEVLLAAQEAFLHEKLRGHYEDYFFPEYSPLPECLRQAEGSFAPHHSRGSGPAGANSRAKRSRPLMARALAAAVCLAVVLWQSAGCQPQPADEVSAALEERVRREPREVSGWNRLAEAWLRLLGKTGDLAHLARAEKAVERSLQLVAAEQNRGGLAMRARVEMASHRFAEARESAKQLRAALPDSAFPLHGLGDALFQLGDYAEAARVWEEIVGQEGSGVATEARFAQLDLIHGRVEQARVRMRRALVLARNGGPALMEAAVSCHLRLGEIAFYAGEWEDAEREYAAALTGLPEDFEALEHLAELRGAQRKTAEAIALYKRLIARTQRPELMQALGDLYVFSRDLHRARPWHDRAEAGFLASIARGEVSAFHHLAGFYTDSRPAPEKAVEWARRDLARRQSIHAHDALAWALHSAGRFEEALAALGPALATGTRDPHILYHAGVIRRSAGDRAGGEAALQEALRANPRYHSFHRHR